MKEYRKCFIFKANFEKPELQLWKQYLKLVEKAIPQTGRYIILADYLHQPKNARKGLASLEEINNILKILQLEAQGSMFLQLSDILVGAINFFLSKRKDRIKRKLAKEAITILQLIIQKNKVEVDSVYATSIPKILSKLAIFVKVKNAKIENNY